MKQIKPVVVGYQQVFNTGEIGNDVFDRVDYITCLTVDEDVELFKNGKQKVRPVYKKESSCK